MVMLFAYARLQLPSTLQSRKKSKIGEDSPVASKWFQNIDASGCDVYHKMSVNFYVCQN